MVRFDKLLLGQLPEYRQKHDALNKKNIPSHGLRKENDDVEALVLVKQKRYALPRPNFIWLSPQTLYQQLVTTLFGISDAYQNKNVNIIDTEVNTTLPQR
jgi:hypothetical protein